jgi:acetylornithine deacetylase/succinyl-diaminopimelate desuccinylase family protein
VHVVGSLGQAVLDAVDARQDQGVQLLEGLIRIDSTNPTFPGVDPEACIGGESACNELLAEAFGRAGCVIHRVAVDQRRANLVAVRKGRGSGPSLLLNGHVDTVPPVDRDNWVIGDPWRPEIRNGRLYGLGSTDMKAGLASMWIAAQAIHDAEVPLSGDLVIQCVVGEETWEHELGTTACLRDGFGADAAIVTEPTSLLRPLTICIVSAGLWALKITVQGKSTHAGNRPFAIRAGGLGDEVGVNALEKGVKVVEALQQLEIEWGITKNHPAFLPGFFNLLPGTFYSDAGYPVPYYFPDKAEIQYDVWHDPRDSAAECAKEIEDFVLAMCQMDTWLRDHPPIFEWMRYYPPLQTSWEHPLAQTLVRAHETVTGVRVPPPSPSTPANFGAAMDGTWLQQAGIPSVVFGPGEMRIAHSKDEYVEIDQVGIAARSLATAVLDWNGVES